MRGVAMAGLGEIDSGDASTWNAWDWIESVADSFGALGPQIFALRRRAADLATAARDAGDQVGYREGFDAVSRLGELYERWAIVNDRLRGWGLGTQLGAVIPPWVLLGIGAATVVTTAAAAAYVLARFGAERKIVELLAAGQITPEETERLLRETEGSDPFGALGSTATLVLLAFGALALWKFSER